MGSNIPYVYNKISSFDNLKRITRFDLEMINGYNDEDFLYNFIYKLNEIIEQQNIVGQAFEQVLNWVNTMLQTYTQEQLQKWLDDGTLESIVNKTLFNKKIGYYSNVEEMINDNDIILNQCVMTTGYYNENDNGGGFYIIKNKEEEDNIGDTIFLNNGLIAKLIIGNEINLSQYGIKEGNFDNHDIFQYAINQSSNLNGIKIKIPCGNFLIKSPLIFKKNIKLEGEISSKSNNQIFTTIIFNPEGENVNFNNIDESGLEYGYLFNCNLSNIEIICNSNTNKALNLASIARSDIKNITVKGGKIGCYLNYNMNLNIERCLLLQNVNYGILVDNDGLLTTTYIKDCYIGDSPNNNNSKPLYVCMQSSNSLLFENCTFESTQDGLYISQQNDVFFNNCYFENIPSIPGNNTFNIGLLSNEYNIATGNKNNLEIPSNVVNRNFINFNNCYIQGSFYADDTVLMIKLGYCSILSFNNSHIVGFNNIYNNDNNINNPIVFINTLFQTIKNKMNLKSSKNLFINCYNTDNGEVYNTIQYKAPIYEVYGIISSAGWYRALSFNKTSNKSPNGFIIIQTVYASTPSESNKIDFTIAGSVASFKQSAGNAHTIVNAVRFTEDSKNYYLEINYALSVANGVYVRVVTDLECTANDSNFISGGGNVIGTLNLS